MRKIFFLFAALLIIATIILVVFYRNIPSGEKDLTENQEIIEKSLALYKKAKDEGIDFSSGPCLGVIDGFAVDIAHNPRESIDSKIENQCPEYASGKVFHFIELTPGGSVIRIR